MKGLQMLLRAGAANLADTVPGKISYETILQVKGIFYKFKSAALISRKENNAALIPIYFDLLQEMILSAGDILGDDFLKTRKHDAVVCFQANKIYVG